MKKKAKSKKTASRHDIEDMINAHAWKSPTFKKKLLIDPKAALSELTKQPIPNEVSIKVIEEGKKECIIVLHPLPSSAGEMSEEELRKVAAADIPVGDYFNPENWIPLIIYAAEH